ncbi:primosomal protein N' [Reyranella sp.]|uniref:primosomal protein N' n=1 Tax=Reyranella sp. TaxID=1929291 RepID=UPI001212ADE0|nr:primosomal protein N' [Reyranella sp.]TAJ83000.1 MAG: primosomal protein N' [Reyranella sp.]
MASSSDSPAATISSDSASELQAEAAARLRPETVENTVKVLLPLPLADAYDYRVPAEMHLVPGHFVVVPLGKREMVGVVWGAGTGEVPQAKLRDVIGVLPALPMADAMRRFVDWVSAYTLMPPGAVLRMAMSAPSALEAPKTELVYRAAEQSDDAALKLTAARRRVLDQLKDGPAMPAAELAHLAGVGTSVVKTMASVGLLEAVERVVRRSFPQPDGMRDGPILSPAQKTAADGLVEKVKAHAFSAMLLDGVPGAGKTEVYFEAIAAALAAGRQVLVLLPEIALTAQWLRRFEDRFGAPPAPWHSGLTSLERRETWRAIAEGRVGVVVGARSALFLPFANLGLIVVDEEHDGSFKQDEGVVYNARDMAVVRARLASAPVVLASATPSLESVVNVKTGRYGEVHLPGRHGGHQLATLSAVDMRRDPPARGRWLSPPVVEAMKTALAAGEQTLLFLNRRGYAPITLCRACGHGLECPQCSAWLVEHRFRRSLVCHHCGHTEAPAHSCKHCGAVDQFVACGPGVERLAEEAQELFPEARLELFTSDSLMNRDEAEAAVDRMINGEIDILIGTQMAAKGHHFPNLTLVAVIDADLGLNGGDLRAAERTFQLLYQVAGRAGREGRPGRALIQTHNPEHAVMQALVSGDRDRFVEVELADREVAGMPPYGRLASLIISGPDPAAVDNVCAALARGAPHREGITVLGPSTAPLALLRGRHRRRFLLKTSRDVAVQPILHAWLERIGLPGSVRLQVDVDPYSFL